MARYGDEDHEDVDGMEYKPTLTLQLDFNPRRALIAYTNALR